MYGTDIVPRFYAEMGTQLKIKQHNCAMLLHPPPCLFQYRKAAADGALFRTLGAGLANKMGKRTIPAGLSCFCKSSRRSCGRSMASHFGLSNHILESTASEHANRHSGTRSHQSSDLTVHRRSLGLQQRIPMSLARIPSGKNTPMETRFYQTTAGASPNAPEYR